MPLNEIVLDFYDRLKSISKSYASLDYEHLDYRKSELIKLNILINDETVDAFHSSFTVIRLTTVVAILSKR